MYKYINLNKKKGDDHGNNDSRQTRGHPSLPSIFSFNVNLFLSSLRGVTGGVYDNNNDLTVRRMGGGRRRRREGRL